MDYLKRPDVILGGLIMLVLATFPLLLETCYDLSKRADEDSWIAAEAEFRREETRRVPRSNERARKRLKEACESLDDNYRDYLHAFIVEKLAEGRPRDEIERLALDWAKDEGFCDNMSCSPCVKAILRYGL